MLKEAKEGAGGGGENRRGTEIDIDRQTHRQVKMRLALGSMANF